MIWSMETTEDIYYIRRVVVGIVKLSGNGNLKNNERLARTRQHTAPIMLILT
jgi:hypothetical protein